MVFGLWKPWTGTTYILHPRREFDNSKRAQGDTLKNERWSSNWYHPTLVPGVEYGPTRTNHLFLPRLDPDDLNIHDLNIQWTRCKFKGVTISYDHANFLTMVDVMALLGAVYPTETIIEIFAVMIRRRSGLANMHPFHYWPPITLTFTTPHSTAMS